MFIWLSQLTTAIMWKNSPGLRKFTVKYLWVKDMMNTIYPGNLLRKKKIAKWECIDRHTEQMPKQTGLNVNKRRTWAKGIPELLYYPHILCVSPLDARIQHLWFGIQGYRQLAALHHFMYLSIHKVWCLLGGPGTNLPHILGATVFFSFL